VYTLVEREKKSFLITTKTVNRTGRISEIVWSRVPSNRTGNRKGPATEYRTYDS